jgi:ABC-type multidrug transport system ATPase subunit/ABC-type multidrug transport system permease subunit
MFRKDGKAHNHQHLLHKTTMTATMPPQKEPRDDDDGSQNLSRHSSIKQTRSVPQVELRMENVTYAPLTKSAVIGSNQTQTQRTTILHNITTQISPYQLTAWMGPSGSGKTSLISVAAALTRPHDLIDDSVITVNGEEGSIPKRLVGVVWQDDLLLSNLTVEENIYFAARLKTSQETPDPQVRELTESTMRELGLLHVRDSLVGSPLSAVRGVSGGERKRVSVAVELVVQPSLLLLDEPTSGLDATTALSLMTTLKDLAALGHSIAVVIHQPRTTIYNMFDHLLLLSKGRAIFDGKPSSARAYLENCPTVAPLPPETGIADWLMDIITDDERKGERTLAKYWGECSKKTGCADLTQREQSKLGRRLSTLEELQSAPKYDVTFWTQLKLLTVRTLKQQRGERLTTTAAILQLVYLFFTALFWWHLPDNTARIYERNSLLFFMLIAQANGVVINAVTVFQRERALLRRERAKKMYGVASYFLAKTMSDMTNNVLFPLLYGMAVYWTANFRVSALAYVRFIIAFYMSLSTAQSMGLFISIIMPNGQLALVLAPPITLFFMIMGGFYIPLQSIHVGIRWATWLSFARYGYSALIINEFEGRDIPCSDDVSVQVGPVGTCPLPGEDVIADMGITGITESYWFNIGMVFALQVVFRFAAYYMLRRTR